MDLKELESLNRCIESAGEDSKCRLELENVKAILFGLQKDYKTRISCEKLYGAFKDTKFYGGASFDDFIIALSKIFSLKAFNFPRRDYECGSIEFLKMHRTKVVRYQESKEMPPCVTMFGGSSRAPSFKMIMKQIFIPDTEEFRGFGSVGKPDWGSIADERMSISRSKMFKAEYECDFSEHSITNAYGEKVKASIPALVGTESGKINSAIMKAFNESILTDTAKAMGTAGDSFKAFGTAAASSSIKGAVFDAIFHDEVDVVAKAVPPEEPTKKAPNQTTLNPQYGLWS